MSMYTPMPLELVLDGWNREPGPFMDLTIRGVTMRVVPVAPGIGRIERLLNAPLDCYLQPEFSPGQTVCYATEPIHADSDNDDYKGSPYLP
jgi:hypothetical protein